MEAVLGAIHALVPRAKPSPYAKRWWTTDLTRLRKTYTYWRNLARAQRRAGHRQDNLESRAKVASKEYRINSVNSGKKRAPHGLQIGPPAKFSRQPVLTSTQQTQRPPMATSAAEDDCGRLPRCYICHRRLRDRGVLRTWTNLHPLIPTCLDPRCKYRHFPYKRWVSSWLG
ncbi:hypothetical protein EDB81DRAFT_312637 [Dactylonectria macrodidyma]|uniref:Uncharacterized protein n=1 Tax=Dactylonectria macrodidyma TaxID=307937 RepID=A0A9P9I968_9HYPO|nr:hypothetical protein EDB81DRAFT_312637 [Dactylonectria macrodidyma]